MCQILLWQNIGSSVLSRANFQSTSPLKVTVVQLKCTQFRLSNLTPWVCFFQLYFLILFILKFILPHTWTSQKLKLSISVCLAASSSSLLWLSSRCCSVYFHARKLSPWTWEWGKPLGFTFWEEGTTQQLPLEQPAFSASCMKIRLYFYRNC